MFDQKLLNSLNECPYTGFETYHKEYYKGYQLNSFVSVFESNEQKTFRILYRCSQSKKYVAGLLLNRLHGSNIYDISGVYTEPDYRRQGLAKGLLVVAKMCFKDVRHSDCLTELGQKFARV